MAEDIKQLIEKIQQEGIKAAEEKAQEIESQARGEAERIIAQARGEGEKIVSEAHDKINKLEAASKLSLTQAGRNLLINLRKEINTLLDKIITITVREALTPAELARILHSLITETATQNKSNIIVSVKREDMEKLEKGFLAELKGEIKKGITIEASEDISAGFLISYDSGKSYFDFTDRALAEYIGQYLKPELVKLFKK